jgi:hypothetical protein
MKKSKKLEKSVEPERSFTIRLTRVHFFYVAAYAGVVLLYDAWKLITYQSLLERWTMAVILLVVTTACWYAARQKVNSAAYYKYIVSTLILLDIYVAAFSVYTQRGMASRAVALFAIPIVISALVGRSALFATAAFSVAAYSFAAVRYFALNPSEGYKVELYGDLAFYSALFFVLAGLLWVVISRDKKTE